LIHRKVNIFGSHNNIIDDNNDDPPKPRASQGRVSIQRGDTIQSQGTTIMHDYDEYDIANEHDLDRIHHLESIQDDSPIKPDGNESRLSIGPVVGVARAKSNPYGKDFVSPFKKNKSSKNVTFNRSSTDRSHKAKFNDTSSNNVFNQTGAYSKLTGLDRNASNKRLYSRTNSNRSRPSPTTQMFGNVFEMNYAPLSRHTKRHKPVENTQTEYRKVKKKGKGHVRKETRLKLAMQQMNTMKLSDLDTSNENPFQTKKKKKVRIKYADENQVKRDTKKRRSNNDNNTNINNGGKTPKTPGSAKTKEIFNQRRGRSQSKQYHF